MTRKLVHFAVTTVLLGFLSADAVGQADIAGLIEEAGLQEAGTAMRDLPGWRSGGKVIVLDRLDAVEIVASQMDGGEVIAVQTEAEALVHAAGAHAIVGTCSQRVLAAAPEAVWVQVYSAGADHCLAAPGIGERRVALTSMKKMTAPVMGEHVIAMVLALTRGLVSYAKHMDSGAWLRDSPTSARLDSIAGKTMLVAGLGGAGTEAARRAAALGMRVTATRRTSLAGADFVDYVGLPEELPSLMAQADVIVNALPLTPETDGMFDAKLFSAAKRGAIFINIGRGQTVVTGDLLDAINAGQIGGAGLDVMEPEPLPPEHPLWQAENVIITPHMANEGSPWTWQAMLLRENARRFAAGEPLLNVVDPALGY